MRLPAWVAIAFAVTTMGAAPSKPDATEPGLTRDEASALAVWIDDDVAVSGKGAKYYDDGFVETVRGKVAGALMARGARVVSNSKKKHDAEVRIGLVELERRSGILKDVDAGTLSIEIEGDGGLLGQVRRRFTLAADPAARAAIDDEIRAAMEELVASPGLVAFAREKAQSRSPAALVSAAGPGGAASKAGRRVAVLEFKGPLGAAVMTAITDEARGALAEALRPKGVFVMTRESMAMVASEMGKDLAQCTAGECEVENARDIGADLVVSGEAIQMDKLFVLMLKLHETARGNLVATKQVRGKDALELMDAVKPAIGSLFK